MPKNILIAVIFLIFNVDLYAQPTTEKKSSDYIANANHENPRMRFKVLDAKISDKKAIFKPFEENILKYDLKKYEYLKPLILEQDILNIQAAIKKQLFSYEDLTMFYLYRIYKYETDPNLNLNALISLNKNAIKEARLYDKALKKNKELKTLSGIPILLKDNIGLKGTATTAGAAILKDNYAKDAFISKKLKEAGAIVLGKSNLSEWAYFFCNGCPLGYSAVGGQTLNPYGRMIFETGGSSSGSGVAVAANYAVAAIGTETSGSILSPSSSNALVGLKPTVGLLSRTGIVPISSTLDTPGPMTKNVSDNAIILQAMIGFDEKDKRSIKTKENYLDDLKLETLKGKRLAVFKSYLNNPNYAEIINLIKENGAEIIEFENTSANLPGFRTLLSLDMKADLPSYFKYTGNKKIKDIADIMAFNENEMDLRAPYGQELFEGILKDTTSNQDFEKLVNNLKSNSETYFNTFFEEQKIDIVLSINNNHAAVAAVGFKPCLTIPMGYSEQKQPQGLTLIAPSWNEKKLLQIAYQIELLAKKRKIPENYKD
jgi:amidase